MRSNLLSAILLVFLIGRVSAANRYSYQSLGHTVSETIGPYINNSGDVAFTTVSGDKEGLLYSGGKFTQIPGLGFGGCVILGMNDNGALVGQAEDANGNFVGCVYQNGVTTSIGFFGTGNFSSAVGINNSGQIAAYGNVSIGGTPHTFLRSNGVNVDLGALSGSNYSIASAINDSGAVVGYSMVNTGINQYVYRPFAYINGRLVDLGDGPGGDSGAATQINNLGQIIGYSASSAEGAVGDIPFIYQNGAFTGLAIFNGHSFDAKAINAAGQVVGTEFGQEEHACIYENGMAVDLNQLASGQGSVTLVTASDINDQGQIVGVASDQSAYVLTPLADAPTVKINREVIGTTKEKLTIKGRVTSSVTRVSYRTQKHTHTAVLRGSTWHFDILLKPGQNSITVIAYGPGGQSIPVKIVVIRKAKTEA